MKYIWRQPTIYLSLAWALVVLSLARFGAGAIAVIIMVGLEIGSRRRRGDDAWLAIIEQAVPWLVAPVGLVILMALAPRPASQVVWAVLLAAWLIWSRMEVQQRWGWLVTAGLGQLVATTALFTALVLRHWSLIFILILTWGSSFILAEQLFVRLGERQDRILASAWGMIVSEISWVLSLWLVSYIMPGGYFMIPQATIIIMSLAYCFMSIYVAHRGARLSRARLAEYAVIGLGLLLIVVAGTKWNGSI